MAKNIRFSFGAPPARDDQPDSALIHHDLFATRLWQARLTALAADLPGWIQAAVAMRAASPNPAGRTCRQGWNSHDLAVLDQPQFSRLRAAVISLCADALAQMHGAPVDFALTSWINMHDPGGFNFAHMHDGCLLSGCFYLRVPTGSGPLVLRDPRPGAVMGPAKGNGPNAYKDVKLSPEAGLVVLFPAWLEHFVEVHAGEDARIAVAFNAVKR